MHYQKSVLQKVQYLIVFGLLLTTCTKQTTWDLSSPDGKLTIKIQTILPEKELVYQVSHLNETGKTPVILSSPLGIEREDQSFLNGLSLLSASRVETIDENYQLLHGKRRECQNFANQRILHFKTAEGDKFDLELRAYNDGIAFRYIFPENDSAMHTVVKESTGFRLPEDGVAFMQPHADSYPSYEQHHIIDIPVGTPSPNEAGWSFPPLFSILEGQYWILITEAGLDRSYCGTRLRQEAEGGLYQIRLPDEAEGNGLGMVNPSSTLPWSTPWRVIMVGESLAPIVESSLVTDLSQPSIIDDTEWIIPGRSSWSWWSHSRSTRDYDHLLKFVDLSAEMGWEYSLIDAGWPNLGKDKIQDLVNYGNERSVGIMLWYHSGGHPRIKNDEQMRDRTQRREEFQSISKIGVKGIKADFFLSDKQYCIDQYIDMLEDAAEYKLLVNFHGCTLPRGWSRTYPNLLTMEAVRGGEMYKAHEDYPAKAPWQNTVWALTRNVVGPMDYTPTGFTDNKYPHLTSYAHELALPVIYESGWLHYIDAVESYLGMQDAVKEMLRAIPAAWDETRFVAGYPGKYVIMARRDGSDWYIGGINGEDSQKEVQVDLAFLGESTFELLLITDGETGKQFSEERRKVDADESIAITMLPYGGFAARLVK